MAKERGNNGQEQFERMTHAAGFGSTWVAEMTEQSLKQGMGALDGMLSTARKAADAFSHQAASIREHSAALVEQTMGNAAEYGSKLARSKDPLEWAEAHSEFVSRQAQAIAAGAQSLGEALVSGSNEVASAAVHQMRDASRKRSEAA